MESITSNLSAAIGSTGDGTDQLSTWIGSALKVEPRVATVNVNNVPIVYKQWGESGNPEILLIHGGAAHSGWWDHIAPKLVQSEKCKVVALDLSGHGDSGHRPHYAMSQWAEEVAAVRQATNLEAKCTVIGHSLGGLITLFLREKVPEHVAQAVIIDSPIGGPEAQLLPAAEGFTTQHRYYASQEAILNRFRAVPDQAAVPLVQDHIAKNTVRRAEEGWTWKFDPKLFSGSIRMSTTVPEVGGRLAFLRSEYGIVPDDAPHLVAQAGGIVVDLPGAGHAPMLDQPGALVASLRTVLASWAKA